MTHNDGEKVDCELCQIEGSGWNYTVRFRTDPPRIARACYACMLAALREGHFIEDRRVEEQFIHGRYKGALPVWEEKKK